MVDGSEVHEIFFGQRSFLGALLIVLEKSSEELLKWAWSIGCGSGRGGECVGVNI